MRALSTRSNHEPTRASRPFDALRDGFVPGEGAAVLVLERLSSAQRRGAPILAELIGYGVSADAYHVTAPDPDGEGAALAIRRALQQARLAPQQVDYINATLPVHRQVTSRKPERSSRCSVNMRTVCRSVRSNR